MTTHGFHWTFGCAANLALFLLPLGHLVQASGQQQGQTSFVEMNWNNPEVDPLPELRQLRADFDSELVKVIRLKVNADSSTVRPACSSTPLKRS